MASYEELKALQSDDPLRNRIEVALTIAANAKIAGTVSEQKWAAAVFSNPKSQGQIAQIAVLADNQALTVAQFANVTDAQIQTGVNKVVDALVVAFNAV